MSDDTAGSAGDRGGPSTHRASRRPALRRPRQGRILGGVAAGLAEHSGIDVSIVRILIVVLTVLTQGLGLVAYIAAVLVIPSGDETQPPIARDLGTRPRARQGAGRTERGATDATPPDVSFWVGVTLLVIGAVWLLTGTTAAGSALGGLLGRDVVLAVVLIAFGVALWRKGERREDSQVTLRRPQETTMDSRTPNSGTDPSQPDPDTPDGARETSGSGADATVPAQPPPDEPPGQDTGQSPGEDSAQDPGEETAHSPDDESARDTGPDGSEDTDAPADDTRWTPPEPSRTRDVLGRTTVGVAAMVAGLLWMMRIAGIAQITAGQVVACALLVVGVGLLVGAFVGRARWLVIVGVLLVPLVLAAELAGSVGLTQLDLGLREGAGEVRVAPSEPAELQDSYRLGAGQFTLDLREVTLDGPTSIDVEMGAGELVVHLPDDVTAEVSAAVGVGQLRYDTTRIGGLGVERELRIVTGDGSGTLTLSARLGAGQIDVRSNSQQAAEQAAVTTQEVR